MLKSSALIRHCVKKRQFSLVQHVAETFTTVHELTALPYMVMIPLSSFLLRTVVTLPLSVWQRKRLVKQQDLLCMVKAVTPVVRLKLASANHKNNLTPSQIILLSIKETRKRQKILFRQNKVQMWKNAILPLVQIPLWVNVSLAIRQLASTPIWENSIDLSVPLAEMPLLLPIILGTCSLANVEYNGKMIMARNNYISGIRFANNVGQEDDRGMRLNSAMKSILNVSRLGTIFMMGVSSQASVILVLYWINSQVYSLVQNMILDMIYPLGR